jgi:hypothetical protein
VKSEPIMNQAARAIQTMIKDGPRTSRIQFLM